MARHGTARHGMRVCTCMHACMCVCVACVCVCMCVCVCVPSSQGGWSGCPCRTSEKTRTRTTVFDTANGGRACPSTLDAQECSPCIPDVDCAVTFWTSWSTCSRTCDGGESLRSRSVTAEQSGDGSGCPDMDGFRDCNVSDPARLRASSA